MVYIKDLLFFSEILSTFNARGMYFVSVTATCGMPVISVVLASMNIKAASTKLQSLHYRPILLQTVNGLSERQ